MSTSVPNTAAVTEVRVDADFGTRRATINIENRGRMDWAIPTALRFDEVPEDLQRALIDWIEVVPSTPERATGEGRAK
jgi:hypothetical protein